jgi:hypothetical protein
MRAGSPVSGTAWAMAKGTAGEGDAATYTASTVHRTGSHCDCPPPPPHPPPRPCRNRPNRRVNQYREANMALFGGAPAAPCIAVCTGRGATSLRRRPLYVGAALYMQGRSTCGDAAAAYMQGRSNLQRRGGVEGVGPAGPLRGGWKKGGGEEEGHKERNARETEIGLAGESEGGRRATQCEHGRTGRTLCGHRGRRLHDDVRKICIDLHRTLSL